MKLHVLWGRPDKNTPIDIHEVSLPIAGLAEAIIGLRLALITDLHYGRFVGDEYTSCVIEQVNAQCPDLICLLGDMVNSSVSQIGSAPSCSPVFTPRWEY